MAANKLVEARLEGSESRLAHAPLPTVQEQPSQESSFAPADDIVDDETLYYTQAFNTGDAVVAHSLLSAADLNGKQGEVVGFQGERVIVRFADVGQIALTPGHLKLL